VVAHAHIVRASAMPAAMSLNIDHSYS
jgi:hypothetical protein